MRLPSGLAADRQNTIQQIEAAISRILLGSPGSDGSYLLPPEATAEPGALLHALYQLWLTLGHSRGPEAHSVERLREWLKGSSIVRSLPHKLKGRLPVSRDEAFELLSVLLTHWTSSGPSDEASSIPFPLPQKASGSRFTILEAAKRLSDVIFGPVYQFKSEEIRVRPSPGVSTAFAFSEWQQDNAIIFPILDRTMYGSDPVAMLHGTRLSLETCLAKPDSSVRLIWLLRSETVRDTLEYVRYLFERSFLSVLFQLLEVSARRSWGKFQRPDVDVLMKHLYVCVHVGSDRHVDSHIDDPEEAADLVLEDFIPTKEPERWKQEGEGFSLRDYGVVVVEKADSVIEYWRYTKTEKRVHVAFSRIESETRPQMVTAHRFVVEAAKERAGEGDPAKRHLNYMEAAGWRVLDGRDFIGGFDLKPKGK